MSQVSRVAEPGAPQPARMKSASARSLTSYVSARMIAVTGVVLAMVLVLEATSSGRLLTATNLGGALDTSAEVGFIAIGVTMLMIGGEFDLSVGQTFVASALTFAALFQPIGIVLAALVALLLGAAIGFLNGFVTLFFGIPSFITTLGSYYVIAGLVILVTGGSPVSLIQVPSSFGVFNGNIGGLQMQWQVLWWLGFAAVAGIVLHKTSFGNHVFAAGGARAAAENTGVRVARVKMALFVLSGVCAAFSGIVLFALYGDVEASAGSGLQLQAIAAAVIGGTALFGGIGTVYGGVIGSFFLGVIDVGLVLSGASTTYYELFVGAVLIAAVVLQAKAEGLGSLARRVGLRRRDSSFGRRAAEAVG